MANFFTVNSHELYVISNDQQFGCLFNSLFRVTTKETSKLGITGPCQRNPPVTGGFPSQRASNAERFSMSWCNHVHWCMYCTAFFYMLNFLHKHPTYYTELSLQVTLCWNFNNFSFGQDTPQMIYCNRILRKFQLNIALCVLMIHQYWSRQWL